MPREEEVSRPPVLSVDVASYNLSPFSPRAQGPRFILLLGQEPTACSTATKVQSSLEERRSSYLWERASSIEKPNKSAAENALANAQIQILRVLAPVAQFIVRNTTEPHPLSRVVEVQKQLLNPRNIGRNTLAESPPQRGSLWTSITTGK